jgi:hypothetical protein
MRQGRHYDSMTWQPDVPTWLMTAWAVRLLGLPGAL